MLNFYISKLSTVSNIMVDKITDKIIDDYQAATDATPIGDDYYLSIRNMVTTFLASLILEFVQQHNAGNENLSLASFRVNLEDEYMAAYSSEGVIDDELLQYVGDWMDDGNRMDEWEQALEPVFQELRTKMLEDTCLMVERDRLYEMIFLNTVTFYIVSPVNDIEWSPEEVPYHLEASTLFSSHEFSESKYVFIKYKDRMFNYDPNPSYEMIPRGETVAIGRLTAEAKHFVEDQQ